jgi:hypothetical protein
MYQWTSLTPMTPSRGEVTCAEIVATMEWSVPCNQGRADDHMYVRELSVSPRCRWSLLRRRSTTSSLTLSRSTLLIHSTLMPSCNKISERCIFKSISSTKLYPQAPHSFCKLHLVRTVSSTQLPCLPLMRDRRFNENRRRPLYRRETVSNDLAGYRNQVIK